MQPSPGGGTCGSEVAVEGPPSAQSKKEPKYSEHPTARACAALSSLLQEVSD